MRALFFAVIFLFSSVKAEDLKDINSPNLTDRQQWLNDYAHTEYTIEEISAGIPHKHLTFKL